MDINNNNYSINFRAKFLNSESLKKVAEYAVKEGKFKELNTARKNIDRAAITKRIKMDLTDTNGYPKVIFTKYEPKRYSSGMEIDEYIPTKQVQYTSSIQINPLEFAFEKIIKLGRNVPKNKMFRNLIFTKDNNKSNFILNID